MQYIIADNVILHLLGEYECREKYICLNINSHHIKGGKYFDKAKNFNNFK